jgi:Cys-tRNA(Pro) deacylase
VANRHSGYLVGGTSPFGTKRPMPTYCEATILDLDHIYINAGARGLLVCIDPKDLSKALTITPVQVAVPNRK